MSAAEPRQHLGNDELTLMLAGELPAADYDRLLAHADACTDCAEVLARLLQAEGDAESGDSGDLTARESADLGPAAVPDPGSRIDHYVVDEAIGRGGMGVVLRARDTALDRDVAIKLLSRRSGAQASERLTREAQAMAKLQHPNVVTVHGVGRYQDRVYLAMELVGGGTLREWCQVADRRWEEVVAMFLQAGEGLAAAHRAGLVHRDFKPSNVMVGEDGRVLVTDFGIASLQPSSEGVPSDGEAPDPRLTQTGVVMGTPRFMAPEQFSGGEVDARADQFAFAVSLYKGLYRGFPYAGRTMQALQRSLTEGAPTPPPQDTAVPRATWRVLERGLRRDADERYPTLAELLAGLRRVLERRRRAKRWTIVAGVAVVGIGAGALASEVTETRPCQGLGGQLKTAWGDARREAVAHALGSVTDPGATHTADAVTAALDRYAAEWTETAEGVCRATHVEGTQSDALLDLRMQCLDQSRLSLRSLSELLATRSETGVLRQSISAVRSLPSPAKCAAASNDDARPAPPEDEAAAVARQRSLVFLGLYDDAYALGAELEATLDDPVLRIDCQLNQSRAAGERTGPADAVPHARQAASMAAELGDDERLAIAQVLVAGDVMDERKYAVGLAHVEAAELAILRAGGDLGQTAMLRVIEAQGRSALLQDDASLAAFDAALTAARQLDDEILVALVLLHRAPALSKRGHAEQAIADAKEGLEIRERVLGEYHPKSLVALRMLATVYAEQARFDEARPLVETAVERVGPLGLGQTARAAGHLALLTIVYLELGLFELALPSARASLRITTALSGADGTTASDTRALLAIALSHLGQHDEAKVEIDRVLRHITARTGPDSVDLAFPSLTAGETYRMAGDSARALALFSQAGRLAPKGHGVIAYTLAGQGKAQADLQMPEAVATLREAVAMEWTDAADHAEAKFELARALVLTGGPGGVELALEAEKVLRHPRSWVAHARVRKWLAEQGQVVPEVAAPT